MIGRTSVSVTMAPEKVGEEASSRSRVLTCIVSFSRGLLERSSQGNRSCIRPEGCLSVVGPEVRNG